MVPVFCAQKSEFNYARVDYYYAKVSMLYVYNGYEIELYEFKRVRVLLAKETGNGFEIITINMTETLYSLVGENPGSYIVKKIL